MAISIDETATLPSRFSTCRTSDRLLIPDDVRANSFRLNLAIIIRDAYFDLIGENRPRSPEAIVAHSRELIRELEAWKTHLSSVPLRGDAYFSAEVEFDAIQILAESAEWLVHSRVSNREVPGRHLESHINAIKWVLSLLGCKLQDDSPQSHLAGLAGVARFGSCPT